MDNRTWKPADLEEWLAHKSTKLDCVVQLLQWHLAEDNRPPLMIDPSAPPIENRLIPNTSVQMPAPTGDGGPDRIIVYVAFPSNNALIVKVSFFFFD